MAPGGWNERSTAQASGSRKITASTTPVDT
jgi:hypothetical protein